MLVVSSSSFRYDTDAVSSGSSSSDDESDSGDFNPDKERERQEKREKRKAEKKALKKTMTIVSLCESPISVNKSSGVRFTKGLG